MTKHDGIREYIATTCMSMYDGCCCGLKKDHVPLIHQCVDRSCDCTWTTAAAEEWMEDLMSIEVDRMRRFPGYDGAT